MVTHFVSILHRHCRSKTNFYVFSYDKTSLKCCASFRVFLALFMEKIQKFRYLTMLYSRLFIDRIADIALTFDLTSIYNQYAAQRLRRTRKLDTVPY